jgi:hypothetical protein
LISTSRAIALDLAWSNGELPMAKKPQPPKQFPPLPKQYVERVDRAWDALEEGDPESAGLEAEELMTETDEHPEVRFLLGAALLESGMPGEAIEHLESCQGQVEDPVVHRFYLASALYENLRVEEAEALFRSVLQEEPTRRHLSTAWPSAWSSGGTSRGPRRSTSRRTRSIPRGFPSPSG